MSDKAAAAFVGLGVMGYPMAGHLAAKGHPMRVYNRTATKSAQWAQEYAGTAHPTPAEAAHGADYVMTCVGNDDDLRSVVLGETGVFAGMKEGAVLIDHTTTSAVVACELAEEAAKRGLGFLDAPVSGGQAGAGQLTKMVNQICISGLVQALSEGMNFAMAAGLDAKRAAEVMSGGAAQSWQMDNRAGTMVDGQFEFGFAVDWMRKDLGICIDESKRNGAKLPVAEMVDKFYAEIQAKGGSRYDTSSLILNLKND